MQNKLKMNILGQTGLVVSEFCLGVLPMGPLQANLPKEVCVGIIRKALELGVNFLDTAESYYTQPYIGEAIAGKREEVIIASKSMSKTYSEMYKSVENSLKELQTDYIDIYHLHTTRWPVEVLEERKGALQCLIDLKKEKVIKSIGLATHNCETLQAAIERDDFDVVFPIINKIGMGIAGGTLHDMINRISSAYKKGKGIYAMKALAGGNLITEIKESFDWVRNIEGISSVAVGLISEDELLYDLEMFGIEGLNIKPAKSPKIKRLFITKTLCKGCSECVEICPNGALSVKDGMAAVEHEKCILCGYCSPICSRFAIRIV